MINVPPGRPVRNSAPPTAEKFHICLLVVLGIALAGAGIVAIGFATDFPGAVSIGAGAIIAAGLIAVFFALLGSRENVPTDNIAIAPLTPDPDPDLDPGNRRPAWPPRTSLKTPD